MKLNNGKNAVTIDKFEDIRTGIAIATTEPNPIPTSEFNFVSDLSSSEGIFLHFGGSAVQDSIEPNFDLQDKISRLEKLTIVMKKTIKTLRKNLDYNTYYNSFLLDQIDEEEFEKISTKFAVSFDQTCTSSIKSDIEMLIKHTNESFAPSEISDIFHIDENEAERVLENLEN